MFTVLPYGTQMTLGLIMNILKSPKNGCFVGNDAYSIGNHYVSKYYSMYPPLQRRGLYEALSPQFCACSGVLKISFYYAQKLGTVHQTADSYTPLDSQAHSRGRQQLLRGN